MTRRGLLARCINRSFKRSQVILRKPIFSYYPLLSLLVSTRTIQKQQLGIKFVCNFQSQIFSPNRLPFLIPFYFSPHFQYIYTGGSLSIPQWIHISPGGSVSTQVVLYLPQWIYISPSGSLSTQVVHYLPQWIYIRPGGSVSTQVVHYLPQWIHISHGGSVSTQVVHYVSTLVDPQQNWWFCIYPGGSLSYLVDPKQHWWFCI